MKYLLSLLFISSALLIHAQKVPLDHDVYEGWKTITNEQISRDGEKVAYVLQPALGDPSLGLSLPSREWERKIPRGDNPVITWDSEYVIFKISPQLDTVRQYKREKKEKDEMPRDSLGIYSFGSETLTKVPDLGSFKVPREWDGWIAYHLEPGKVEKDTTEKAQEIKEESAENGSKLILRELGSGFQDTIWYVTDYLFARKGEALLAVSTGDDSLRAPGIYYYDMATKQRRLLFKAKGKFSQLSLDEPGTQAAFLADLDTTKARVRPYELYYWNTGLDSAALLVNASHEAFPADWRISENGRTYFSEDGNRLFFGTAPQPILQDTTLIDDEIIDVEVWTWEDQRLITEQNVEKETDRKKTFLAMVIPSDEQVFQLENKEIPVVSIGDEGNSRYALATSDVNYQKYSSWEGYPVYTDIYRLDLVNGDLLQVAEKVKAYPSISPAGQYIYWYDVVDSAYYAYDNTAATLARITDNGVVPFYDEENDVPDYPGAYGIAGWLKEDQALWIYDRYDIWQVAPSGREPMRKLTGNGRLTRNVYRYVRLDPEKNYIDTEEKIYLQGFNEISRGSGFFELNQKKAEVNALVWDEDYYFSGLARALESRELIFTYENYEVFPDLQYTRNDFRKVTRISTANPQQSDYLWGSVELVKWNALDGQELEGMLYKPENFDPSKKYPMMVYFYEKNSNTLHRHRAPEPHRSIINFTFYASRGYLVFVPDIPYQIGYPGPSAVNAVLPGVSSLLEKGFVDRERIGVQGHSWGGYQSAYLITRTDIFRCAEAGAPVSNMISAYGGIRWGSGISRMFQYEHTQSRIGGSLWEYPLRYVENSPIFFADKINTPLLIMHNDQDGAVPWYQGIELFVALRRLNKPVWMINYRGEPHWPTKFQNKKDWAIRMQQYFDHYLKDAPMPEWMAEGVPALETGINQGYKLIEE